EGGGLVPTHPGDRELVLAIRVTPQGPGRRPWLARRVPEQGHRLLPREGLAVLREGMLPELLPAVPASGHERLELAVRHLEAVHPELGKAGAWVKRPFTDEHRADAHHAAGRDLRPIQLHPDSPA